MFAKTENLNVIYINFFDDWKRNNQPSQIKIKKNK